MVFKNRKLIVAATVGLLLLSVLVLPSSISQKGKGVVRDSMAPLQRGTFNLGQRFREALSAIRDMGDLAARNEQLARELIYIQAELNDLREVKQENLNLRRELDFHNKFTSNFKEHELIACNVISRNISGWWNSVRLGKGKMQGIQKNQAVISPDGLVGKTSNVSQQTADVLLVCDPACRISAKIIGANTFGLVRGRGANAKGHPMARMEFINKDAEILIGDEVVTSGLGGDNSIFPKGIHIGYIEALKTDESGLYQYADIVPRATDVLLERVFVLGDIPEETQE